MSTEQQESSLDMNQLLAVLRAAKQGDFSPRMDAGGSGVAAEIAAAVNALQEQNELFANEVGRVAHEVGHKGMLGGQAQVPDASGQWKMLIDSINFAGG
jgi:methyl-accepting chemotaxis protein